MMTNGMILQYDNHFNKRRQQAMGVSFCQMISDLQTESSSAAQVGVTQTSTHRVVASWQQPLFGFLHLLDCRRSNYIREALGRWQCYIGCFEFAPSRSMANRVLVFFSDAGCL
jgi:hypothetical protein